MGFITEEIQNTDKRYDYYIGIGLTALIVWACWRDYRSLKNFISQ